MQRVRSEPHSSALRGMKYRTVSKGALVEVDNDREKLDAEAGCLSDRGAQLPNTVPENSPTIKEIGYAAH